MQILLVDDERKFGLSMQQGLSEAGFSVDLKMSGEAGLEAFRQTHYDVILLDLMLPALSGWDVLTEIRKTTDTPVLILSACDSDADRQRALALGANDYHAKPVNFTKLLAKINCLTKARQCTDENLIVLKELVIDRTAEQVSRAGIPILLSPKEFKLLLLLARYQGKVLPRELIAEHVWGMSLDSDQSVVDTAVRRLQEKVDKPFQYSLVHIVPGAGYALKE